MADGTIVFSPSKTLLALHDLGKAQTNINAARDGFLDAIKDAQGAWNCNAGSAYLKLSQDYYQLMDSAGQGLGRYISRLDEKRSIYIASESQILQMQGDVSAQYGASAAAGNILATLSGVGAAIAKTASNIAGAFHTDPPLSVDTSKIEVKPTSLEGSFKESHADGSYEEGKIKLGMINAGKAEETLSEQKAPSIIDRKGRTDLTGSSAEREHTILEVGVSAESKKAMLHGDAELSNQYSKLNASYDFMYSEMETSLAGGLYTTKVTTDGKVKRCLEPGVSAEYKQSFGLAKGDVSGRVGTDDVSLTGKLKGEVLAGEFGGQANMGIVDGGLAAYGEMSAEFNLVKAGGEIGVDLFGVEGTVGAEISVGVGGHAELGFHDGTFTYDVGASLGVGASVKGEINVDKFIDNQVKAAQEACKNVVEFGENVSRGMERWGRNVARGAQVAGDMVGDLFDL